MSEKSKMLFQFLTVCGTLCILASLGGVLYLYLENAVLMGAGAISGSIPKEVSFFMFVVTPAAIVFATGLGMVIFGIRVALKDNSL
jgi:hypothetical protein